MNLLTGLVLHEAGQELCTFGVWYLDGRVMEHLGVWVMRVVPQVWSHPYWWTVLMVELTVL